MKVVVFGFSVTGDTPGYVEFWKKNYADRHPDINLEKVGIGGIQPPQGRHLVSWIIRKHQPDILILEISTPIYRMRLGDEKDITEHTDTVNFLVELCAKNNIRCGFIDLPQERLVIESDWLGRIHHKLLGSYGVPLVSVGLTPGTLRDAVHPNDTGRDIYAAALEQLIEQTLTSSPENYHLAKSDRMFDAIHVAEIERTGGEFVDFERNGFRTKMLQLAAEQSATFHLSRPMEIVGVIVAMGPVTGYMAIRINGSSNIICCYDKHCYYLRLGSPPIEAKTSDNVTVTQGKNVPRLRTH
ncbi:MAG: hypothetical protein AB7E60_14650 [Sphingobium sp.]